MKKQDTYIYPAIFEYSKDGIAIEFPDLEGCFSCADNDTEALYMAKDAMRGWLLLSEEDNDEIPEPTPLKAITLEANQKAVLIEVCLAFYREANANKAVKKTLTVPFWLNDLAEKQQINFSYVLQKALKEELQIQNK